MGLSNDKEHLCDILSDTVQRYDKLETELRTTKSRLSRAEKVINRV